MKLPQLSLRELFWLLLVCGLASAWWRQNRVYAVELANLRDELRIARELTVVGQVTQVNAGRGFAEISLGSDDGLKLGHMSEIHRGNHCLAKLVWFKVGPDRSVGTIKPEPKGMPIQKDDRCTAVVGRRTSRPVTGHIRMAGDCTNPP